MYVQHKWIVVMMEQQEKIKDSPFYVDYKGNKNPTIPCHASQSFIDALSKHLKDKYPTMLNRQGNHNLGACVRLILENYLNLQCLSRKTYDYNIVVIIGDKQLGKDGFHTYGVVNDKSNKENILTGHSRKLYWANINEKELNNRYDYSDLSLIEKLVADCKNKHDCDAVYVVDMPLNNFFDEYVDGVYTYDAENKALHCGVNLITTSDNIYCMVYTWYINQDYKPMINTISFEDLEQTMQDLSDVNVNAFINFEKSLSVLEDKLPKDEVERLKKQNETFEKQIKGFEDAIKFAQEKLDANNLRLEELDK